MAGKNSSWNPWEMFKETPEELQNIEKRKAIRSVARAEWMKKKTSPYSSGSGYIFDPALQRIVSAKMTRFQHFNVSSRTTLSGFLLYVFPIGLLCYSMDKYKTEYYRGVNSGEITADKQTLRFMW
ncbi:uncharacterized protein LOC132548656 [Ylistrum balloti]|uniref:uncharacterized protein LOC132548656 n=1 Tax=Ylistrum balloti TaxID=509963 RepID=UPI002905F4FF|nr:uncharacterized protein LOC132548656 [Ylistrum balloti]